MPVEPLRILGLPSGDSGDAVGRPVAAPSGRDSAECSPGVPAAHAGIPGRFWLVPTPRTSLQRGGAGRLVFRACGLVAGPDWVEWSPEGFPAGAPGIAVGLVGRN